MIPDGCLSLSALRGSRMEVVVLQGSTSETTTTISTTTITTSAYCIIINTSSIIGSFSFQVLLVLLALLLLVLTLVAQLVLPGLLEAPIPLVLPCIPLATSTTSISYSASSASTTSNFRTTSGPGIRKTPRQPIQVFHLRERGGNNG
jgi:hypothetical protein